MALLRRALPLTYGQIGALLGGVSAKKPAIERSNTATERQA
jgi:hypothetical protein